MYNEWTGHTICLSQRPSRWLLSAFVCILFIPGILVCYAWKSLLFGIFSFRKKIGVIKWSKNVWARTQMAYIAKHKNTRFHTFKRSLVLMEEQALWYSPPKWHSYKTRLFFWIEFEHWYVKYMQSDLRPCDWHKLALHLLVSRSYFMPLKRFPTYWQLPQFPLMFLGVLLIIDEYSHSIRYWW